MNGNRAIWKSEARAALAQTRPRPIWVTLVYSLITYGVSIAVSLAGAAGGGISSYYDKAMNPSVMLIWLFLNVLLYLFSSVMQFGYTAYSLHVTDGEETGYRDLFSGFTIVGRVVLMQLALAGFYFVWSLAVVLPTTLVGSVLFTAILMGAGEAAPVGLLTAGLVVLYLIMIAAILILTVRYSLATYALADNPAVGPLGAIRRSRTLLRGRTKECLLLQLSFLGWALLAALLYTGIFTAAGVVAMNLQGEPIVVVVGMVLGLLAMLPILIWLQPYMSVTMGKYYRQLSPRPDQGAEQELPNPATPWRPEE